nr:uncharacterized protein CI109_003391 [Kwoniella shandongensis]KAA5528103.1 hypothetical protein CI109_003391 [Kwoniella shandongensis]
MQSSSTVCDTPYTPAPSFNQSLNIPHYHPTPPTLLVSSQQSRSATQNHQTALLILYNTILSSAESLIINPTSSEQRAKVKGFVKRENERRLEGKKRNGAKKAARRDFD